MKLRTPLLLASLATVSLLALAPSSASAGPRVGADVGLAVPTDLKAYSLGSAANLQLGYELELGPLALGPEVYAGYIQLGNGDEGDKAKLYRATAGGRLGFGSIFRPFVAAHAGWGWRSEGDLKDSALSADAQLGTDFTLLPILNLGASLGYTALFRDGNVDSTSEAHLGFVTGSVQAALAF